MLRLRLQWKDNYQ